MSARSRTALARRRRRPARSCSCCRWARRTIRSEAVLRPAGVSPTSRRPSDGVVERVSRSQEGDNVAAGAELLRIVNPAAQAESRAIRGRERAHGGPRERRAAGRRRVGPSPKRKGCAPRRGRRAREGRRRAESALDQEPHRRPRADAAACRSRRRFRHGGPPARSRSADCSKLVAELPVSERLLDDLAAGRARPRPARPAPDPAGPRHDRPHLARRRSTSPSPRAGSTILPRPSSGPTVSSPSRSSTTPTALSGRAMSRAPRSMPRARPCLARTWRVLRRWVQTIVW